MENFTRILVDALLAAIGGLIVGCLLGGLAIGPYILLTGGVSLHSLVAGFGIGLVIAMFAVMYGALPALLYGAPTYALLIKWGYANYWTVSVLGALPGLVLLLVKPDFAGVSLLFGVLVAWCTHLLAKRHRSLRGLGPNNSFKPKPLRGSA